MKYLFLLLLLTISFNGIAKDIYGYRVVILTNNNKPVIRKVIDAEVANNICNAYLHTDIDVKLIMTSKNNHFHYTTSMIDIYCERKALIYKDGKVQKDKKGKLKLKTLKIRY